MRRQERFADRARRVLGFAAPLALAAYAFCALFVWIEPDWRPEWDSALYVLTGRSLAEGTGYRYLGEPFVLRPPGFPWLISFVSDGPFDAARLNRLVMAFAAALPGAVYFAFVRGHGRGLALGAALAAGASPLVVERFNWVLSEFPFMTLLYLGFGLVVRSDEGPRAGLAALLAVLALAAAFWMRTVATLVLPGLLLLALAPSVAGRRRALGVLAAILVLCAPWWLWVRAVGSGGLSDQLFLADYATALLRVDPGDPGSAWLSAGDWLARLETNGTWLLRSVARTTFGAFDARLGGIVALLVGAGVLRTLLLRPALPEWFFLGYTALLLAYFDREPRLLVPIVPLVYLHLLAATAALADLAARAAPRLPLRGGVVVLASLGLLAAGASRLPAALDVRSKPMLTDMGETKTYRARFNDVARVAEEILASTPPDAVLLCHDAPVYALLTGRRAYSHRFAPGPGLLHRYAPDFVVFDRRTRQNLRFARLVAARAARRWIVPSDQFEGGIAIYALHDAPGAEAGPGPPPAHDPR
jgi:hypothetical protein